MIKKRVMSSSNNALLHYRILTSILSCVLGLALVQLCEAQQIPRRIDTSVYQNRSPAAPKLSPPGVWTTRTGIKPSTGQPIKIYQKEQIRVWPGAGVSMPPGPVVTTPGTTGTNIRPWPGPGVSGTVQPPGGNIRSWR